MKLLFFTPHSALWPHTAPEAYLARGLSECGHTINYLSCGKALTYCAPMTARRLAPGCTLKDSARICAECIAASNTISRSYRFQVDLLAQYLNDADFQMLDAMAASAVAAKSLETNYLGVDVGRLALYEFTLAHKKMSIELNELQWVEYQVYLANALRSLQGFARYLELHRPDAILTFSPQYSNINSPMQYAINEGVRVFFLESGTNLGDRLSTMRVWDWKVHKLVNPALTYWKKSELNPVTPASAAKVAEHFEQLLSGKHFAVFSTPYLGRASVRQRWNVNPDQKILLMTLSSYDEAYAALLINGFPHKKVFSDVFSTQADWVKDTANWVAERKDLFLVIRVHPRDFPNKRESLRSEQSFMLEHLLEHVPANVHVNWPSEGVSLYELLEDTDVVVTGWSVTAMEALLLGIPVVTYDANLPSYPEDIHYTGRSVAEYYSNINRALVDGWRLVNAINGFRWLAYNFVTCTVTVAKDFGRFELGPQSLLSRLWTRLRSLFPTLGFSIDLYNWRHAVPGARVVSAMLEQGYDALPPARQAHGEFAVGDDKPFVVRSLSLLFQRLCSDGKLSEERSGLSQKIRSSLVAELHP